MKFKHLVFCAYSILGLYSYCINKFLAFQKPYEQIDFVYTWVNGSNPEVLQLKYNYGRPAVVNERDRNSDELKYSLRSFAQWVGWWHTGRIFIVTQMGEIPHWLNINHPKVIVIDQNDLIPREHQPTMNSFNVEWNLDKIPGLSDPFIYLNDDYIFNRRTSLDFFIDPTSLKPKAYLSKRTVSTKPKKDNGKWISKFIMALQFTQNVLKEQSMRVLEHAPYTFYKESFEVLRKKYDQEIHSTLNTKFRSSRNFIPTYAIIYSEMFKYTPIVDSKNLIFGTITDDISQNKRNVARILQQRPNMYNLNTDFKLNITSLHLKHFLESRFPVKSEYEK